MYPIFLNSVYLKETKLKIFINELLISLKKNISQNNVKTFQQILFINEILPTFHHIKLALYNNDFIQEYLLIQIMSDQKTEKPI